MYIASIDLDSAHLRWGQGDFKEVPREAKKGDSKGLHERVGELFQGISGAF